MTDTSTLQAAAFARAGAADQLSFRHNQYHKPARGSE
jgi:hypothetical protein